MKLSAKGRYALAAATDLAQQSDKKEYVTVLSISERLEISKIYLEQVFSLLRRSELVLSAKGAQGGYRLSRPPEEITVLDVLLAVELSLFEKTQETVPKTAPDLEYALHLLAFDKLDQAVKETLCGVTLADLASEAEKQKKDVLMFYI